MGLRYMQRYKVECVKREQTDAMLYHINIHAMPVLLHPSLRRKHRVCGVYIIVFIFAQCKVWGHGRTASHDHPKSMFVILRKHSHKFS